MLQLLLIMMGLLKHNQRGLKKKRHYPFSKKLRDSGMDEYPGKEIQIWSESRPTIPNQE